MDIITHALMGSVAASPWFATHPLEASCFVLGSVFPDLDALSRLFGKRAFLAWHQTWSHAIPVILLVALVLGLGLAAFTELPAAGIALAFGAGMLGHSLLDFTNTYGVGLLLPFSRKRYCREWVFFIDASIIALSLLTLLAIAARIATTGEAGWRLPVAWMSALGLYIMLKIIVRSLAGKRAPEGTLALLPSALLPWRFYGCARQAGATEVSTFTLNALTGSLSKTQRWPVYDATHEALLETLEEVQVMRTLTPAYHVVEQKTRDDNTQVLRLRDLRTRNFSTRFGELELIIGPDGILREKRFHV